MSAQGSRIWVVITDGVNTRICSCEDGMASPIATPVFNVDSIDIGARDLAACKAWFKTEGRRGYSPNPRRQHVRHISQLLLEAARDKAYDGLIIIAAEPAAAELKEAMAPETRALLMGKIVRDLAGFDAPAPCETAELRH
jgi:Protein required for attachment to host cells